MGDALLVHERVETALREVELVSRAKFPDAVLADVPRDRALLSRALDPGHVLRPVK